MLDTGKKSRNEGSPSQLRVRENSAHVREVKRSSRQCLLPGGRTLVRLGHKLYLGKQEFSSATSCSVFICMSAVPLDATDVSPPTQRVWDFIFETCKGPMAFLDCGSASWYMSSESFAVTWYGPGHLDASEAANPLLASLRM